VNYDNSLVVTITVTYYSWAPSSDDHLFSCGAISRPPHYFSLLAWSSITFLSILWLSIYKFDPFPLVQDDLQRRMLLRGAYDLSSQVPYRAPFVAVDCIALNYW